MKKALLIFTGILLTTYQAQAVNARAYYFDAKKYYEDCMTRCSVGDIKKTARGELVLKRFCTCTLQHVGARLDEDGYYTLSDDITGRATCMRLLEEFEDQWVNNAMSRC
jgi:hypothetical protein